MAKAIATMLLLFFTSCRVAAGNQNKTNTSVFLEICGEPATGKQFKLGKNRDSNCTDCVLNCFENATTTTTQSWNCTDAALQLPLQFMRCSSNPKKTSFPDCHTGFETVAEGHGIYLLDIAGEKGEYKSVFTIPRSQSILADNYMNACGISPVDSFVYCIIDTQSSTHSKSRIRLIRFGSGHPVPSNAGFDYVAILPPSTEYNTASFDADGNFYFLDPDWNKKLFVLSGTNRPDKLRGVSAATSCVWTRSKEGWYSKGIAAGDSKEYNLAVARRKCLDTQRDGGDKSCKDVTCSNVDDTCTIRQRQPLPSDKNFDANTGLIYTGKANLYTYSYSSECLEAQSFDSANLADLSGLVGHDMPFTGFADVGLVKGALDGGAKEEFYGIMVTEGPRAKIGVFRSPLADAGFAKWEVDSVKVGGSLKAGSWGSAWIYKNKFFAASNDGDGKLM